MIWFLTLLVAVAVAGWCAGVWWGRRVDGVDDPDRWYADDPNREQR